MTDHPTRRASAALIEAQLADMQESARLRRGKLPPTRPLLLPPNCVDVTAQAAGRTITIIGAPQPKARPR
jgi:hypothetical protein